MDKLRALGAKVNPLKDGVGLRYLAVIAAGFVIDISIAWSVHILLGVDLVITAALGFFVATVLSYFAHEFWTFRHRDSAYSGARLLKFLLAAGATLTTRLALVWASAPLADLPAGALIRLLLAFAGSVVVGYLVNRLLVFGARE